LQVLHIYRTYFPDPPGGLQEAIRQIAMATKSLGAEPVVFTLSPKPNPHELHIDGVRVIRDRSWFEISSCDIGGLKSVRTFRKLAQEADIIHYHFPWPFADFLNWFAPSSVPKVLTYHSDIVRQRVLGSAYLPIASKLLASMDRIVPTSLAYAKSSQTLANDRWQSKLNTIPLGIADQRKFNSGNAKIFDRLNLSLGEPYFLFIGMLRYYKGLRHLIDASQKVQAKVVVVGVGPASDEIQHQANMAGITNVVFAGSVTVEEKFALLAHCLALVLPSHRRSEAFGMVLVEASMYGKPMITCEIGTGTSFVNQHGKTGLVTAPSSPHELAAAMNKLLTDPHLRTIMGLNARKRYEALFSGHALGSAYMRLYNELVTTK